MIQVSATKMMSKNFRMLAHLMLLLMALIVVVANGDDAVRAGRSSDSAVKQRVRGSVKQVVKERVRAIINKHPINDLSLTPRSLILTPRDAQPCEYTSNFTCTDREDKYRTISGVCNNPINKEMGMSGTPYRRLLDPQYSERGIDTDLPRKAMSGNPLPSPRLICVGFNNESIPFIPAPNFASLAFMSFAQYTNHDIASTMPAKNDDGETLECLSADCGDGDDPDCVPIEISPNEPAREFKDFTCLPFARSEGGRDLKCSQGTRQQINTVTHFIDASTVYGSTDEQHRALREELEDGKLGPKMKMRANPVSGRKPLLPLDENCPRTHCTMAGDDRVDMQINLAVLHVIFVRQHNLIVDELRIVNPDASDEVIFQEARKIVVAITQHIMYNEYLPLLLGSQRSEYLKLKPGYFSNYIPQLDMRISNVFIAAAYRFGHSTVPSKVYDGKQFLDMSETYYKSERLDEGIDEFFLGMWFQSSYNVDSDFTSALTTKLFGSKNPNVPRTQDLVSINIQRGRDHGIPGYAYWREACSLKGVYSFDDLLKSDIFGNNTESITNKLKSTYEHILDLDLFPTALYEKPEGDSLLGATLQCIIEDAFIRMRLGDRFWYENEGIQGFTPGQLSEIKQITLAKIVCNNGDNVQTIRAEIMKTEGAKVKCNDIPDIDWKEFKI